MSRRAAAAIAVALAVRLLPVVLAPRLTGDVFRYQRVARHVLDVSWNPYETRRLYPYPPVWVWVEAGCEWLARTTGLAFAALVKLPIIAADAWIVAHLARAAGARAAWAYALHPVGVLISAVHGQFDAIALLFVLLALRWQEDGREARAALALAAAIALKSFPVLLLPVFVLSLPRQVRFRFVALATLPVAALLLPFLVASPVAVGRELLAYGGVADFGWIALVRGLRWLSGHGLERSGDAESWPTLVPLAKLIFLAVWAALVTAWMRAARRPPLPQASLAVFLAFLVFYGALSAQYLLWVVPLGLLRPDRYSLAYAIAATLALLGFYAFLAPDIVFGAAPVPRAAAGIAWVAGVAAVLVLSAGWLASTVRRSLAPAP
jgi:hypothetical protein